MTEQDNTEGKKYEPKLIPFSEIDAEAREIAVAWCENYVPHGSHMPEIAQKHKLASDIINYHLSKTVELNDHIKSLESEAITLAGAYQSVGEELHKAIEERDKDLSKFMTWYWAEIQGKPYNTSAIEIVNDYKKSLLP